MKKTGILFFVLLLALALPGLLAAAEVTQSHPKELASIRKLFKQVLQTPQKEYQIARDVQLITDLLAADVWSAKGKVEAENARKNLEKAMLNFGKQTPVYAPDAPIYGFNLSHYYFGLLFEIETGKRYSMRNEIIDAMKPFLESVESLMKKYPFSENEDSDLGPKLVLANLRACEKIVATIRWEKQHEKVVKQFSTFSAKLHFAFVHKTNSGEVFTKFRALMANYEKLKGIFETLPIKR